MLKTIGIIINLGIVFYLGFQAKSCLSPEQIADFNAAQNPLVLSFVAVIALYISMRNK
jgi:hypothetical protein